MILILAGTSDARELAKKIKEVGHETLATVVTENGAIALKNLGIDVLVGRLTKEDMIGLFVEKKIDMIIDATHPFAEEASKNAVDAAVEGNIPYIRYERPSYTSNNHQITYVDSYQEAANVAAKRRGVIMLTTGSKTLQTFTETLHRIEGVRLIARMLPRKDNMEKCEQLGVEQKNIVAIQGPFTKELNKALYIQYNVTLMITKESGKVGSVDEKVEAAKDLEIPIIMIKRPKMNYGTVCNTFDDVLKTMKSMR
ncbi:precorrin-6A reductase [Bacillus sp. FJAT-45350]|uniref:precorrin-6A reductase n=1 Tax=Bacillus sp. FJAT-45350 TaxID=2011014 RepID=UPI000BB77A66|nr:precorrin-6A reductase [Bacillus sp. FJAT-45350]